MMLRKSNSISGRAIVGPPNENRSISRLGKGTCEDHQVLTAMGFQSQREMRLPEGGAPS
jgi:hypothetical protein